MSGEGAAFITPGQAEWSGRWVWPQVLVMLHPPWLFPGALAALGAVLRVCHLGASPQQNSTLGGYQASQHRLSQGAQSCPLRGDNSGHSSNLELFNPYQLVSAGLPNTGS